MRILGTAAALGVVVAFRAAAQSPSDSLCIFSGPERSALAWQSAARSFTGGGIEGHIVRLRDLQPIRYGSVNLEPGTVRTLSDSANHFAIKKVPSGRYLLRVRALGFPQVADSITLGADGLVVLAALSDPQGDIAITCPTRSVPSRRPPNGR